MNNTHFKSSREHLKYILRIVRCWQINFYEMMHAFEFICAIFMAQKEQEGFFVVNLLKKLTCVQWGGGVWNFGFSRNFR